MLLFVYGMVGWTFFADELPEQWGNIGRAMLTLFVMLTLENFPTYMEAGMDVHPWSWVYFVSFIMIAAFVVINVLIGIVLNSMEEAREAERRNAVRDRLGAGRPSLVDPDASARRRRADRDPPRRARRARGRALDGGAQNARSGGVVAPSRVLVLQHIACEPPGVYEDVLLEHEARIERWSSTQGGAPCPASKASTRSGDGRPDERQRRGRAPLARPGEAADRGGGSAAAGTSRLVVFGSRRPGVRESSRACGSRACSFSPRASGPTVAPGEVPEVGVLPVYATEAALSDPGCSAGALRRRAPSGVGRASRRSSGTATRSRFPTARRCSRPSPAYPHQAFLVVTAYGVQFHLEVTDHMATEWAQVPEYIAAAERTLGPGGLDRLLGRLQGKRRGDARGCADVVRALGPAVGVEQVSGVSQTPAHDAQRERGTGPSGWGTSLGEDDHLGNPRPRSGSVGMVELDEVAGRVAEIELRLTAGELGDGVAERLWSRIPSDRARS